MSQTPPRPPSQPQPKPLDETLFSPSLNSSHASGHRTGPKPWRLGSQIYVAFFGGTIAATLIALLNGRRLGLDRGKMLLVGATGTAVSLATVALVMHILLVGRGEATPVLPAWIYALEGRMLRYAHQGIAMLLAGGLIAIQRPADRLYQVNASDDQPYASLWLMGTLLVFASWLIVIGGSFAILELFFR